MLRFSILSIILILSIIDSAYSQLYQSSRPFWQKKTSLSNIEQNSCTYGGGVINNSTVIEIGNCFNDLYFIGLSLGTGPSGSQYFNFQFDTGSPTLWIPVGSNSSSFNPASSTTYQLTNITNTITYADNSSVGGYMGFDIVSVKGTPIKANNSILFATNDSVSFDGTNVYGLVGMDYPSTPNFLDDAFFANQIATPVFALDLNYQNQTSYMYYNNGLSKTILQQTYWINLFGTDHWQLEVIGFAVAGNDMTSSAFDTAVVDSGTSLLVLNPDIYNSIMQQYFSFPECYVDQQGLTNCYCNRTWPTLSFMFKGAQVYVPGSGYQNPSSNGYCQVELQTLSTVSQIILGDVFFRGYTVSFDRVNTQVGFYGQTTPVSKFDPLYFAVTQYVLCGLGMVMAFVGVGMWLAERSQLESKVQRNLGVELLRY